MSAVLQLRRRRSGGATCRPLPPGLLPAQALPWRPRAAELLPAHPPAAEEDWHALHLVLGLLGAKLERLTVHRGFEG